MPQPRIRPYLATHLPAIETRHHIVQQNDIGLKIPRHVQSILTGCRCLEVVAFAQQLLDSCDIDNIVIDGQNFVSRLHHHKYIGQKTTLF